jgi:hypothetical protein
MGRKDKGFAESVRKAMRAMPREPMFLQKIAEQLDLVSDAAKQPLYTVIRDFVKSGEITRVEPNQYLYVGTLAERCEQPQLREIMWRILRARRSVTVDDLMELTGASREYAGQWLRMLVRQGMADKRIDRHMGGTQANWVLVSDPVAMPTDDSKAERLRQIRERKKSALNKLDACINMCLEARMAVAEALDDGN